MIPVLRSPRHQFARLVAEFVEIATQVGSGLPDVLFDQVRVFAHWMFSFTLSMAFCGVACSERKRRRPLVPRIPASNAVAPATVSAAAHAGQIVANANTAA